MLLLAPFAAAGSQPVLTDIAAVGGVLVSLFVGVLAYLPARRRHPNTRALADGLARDRLIDQLQERIEQQAGQLEHCEESHAHTRAVLESTLDQLDDLRRLYRSALTQIDALMDQVTALSRTHHNPHEGEQ